MAKKQVDMDKVQENMLRLLSAERVTDADLRELEAALRSSSKKVVASAKAVRDRLIGEKKIHVNEAGTGFNAGPKPAAAPAAKATAPAGPAAKKAVDPAELAAADKAAQERAAREAAAKAEEARKAAEAAEKAKKAAAKTDAKAKAKADFEAAKREADRKANEARLAKQREEAEAAAKKLEAQKKAAKKPAAPAKSNVPKPEGPPKRRATRQTRITQGTELGAAAEGLPELRAKTAGELAAEVTTPARGGSVGSVSVEANQALTGLKARNFKKEFAALGAKQKTDLLKRAFGSSAFPDPVLRNKAGELAMAMEAMEKAGFGGDKNLLGFDLKKRLREAVGPTTKSVEAIENLHGRILTASTGKIRGNVFAPGRVPAGAVAGAKPRTPPLEPRPASPGFETAREAKVPASARTTIKTGTIGPDGELPELAPRGAAPAPATPAAPAAKAAAPAAAAATKGRSAFQEAVLADPAKYGTGFGRGNVQATPEQKKARRELNKALSGEARAARAPGDQLRRQLWGEGIRANPTKYGKPGTPNAKLSATQKAARNQLWADLTAKHFPEGAAAAKGAKGTKAPKAVPAPTPGTPGPKVPPGPKGAAPTAPAPTTPAPTAPGTPTPAAAGAAAGEAGGLKEAAKKIGKKGAGLGRFLGPLFAIFGAYEVMNMLREGTVGAADQRRMRALEALGNVGGGMQQDVGNRQAIAQMQSMVDLAGIQRQRALDQMSQQYTGNQALDALLRAQQASLNTLAMPSRPSIAEMMARM